MLETPNRFRALADLEQAQVEALDTSGEKHTLEMGSPGAHVSSRKFSITDKGGLTKPTGPHTEHIRVNRVSKLIISPCAPIRVTGGKEVTTRVQDEGDCASV